MLSQSPLTPAPAPFAAAVTPAGRPAGRGGEGQRYTSVQRCSDTVGCAGGCGTAWRWCLGLFPRLLNRLLVLCWQRLRARSNGLLGPATLRTAGHASNQAAGVSEGSMVLRWICRMLAHASPEVMTWVVVMPAVVITTARPDPESPLLYILLHIASITAIGLMPKRRNIPALWQGLQGRGDKRATGTGSVA